MLQRDLILEKPHIVMVTLEAVLHHEQVHTDESRLLVLARVVIILFHDFGLTDLIRAFDLLDESWVRVYAVTLFKNDRIDLGQRLLHALGLNLELGRVEVDDTFIAEAHLPHLREALLDGFALDSGEILVRFPNILVCVLRQQGKVASWNHLSKDGLGPLLPSLVLILDLEIFRDESGSGLHYFDYFVLQDQQLTGKKVYLEEHLICDGVDIAMVNFD